MKVDKRDENEGIIHSIHLLQAVSSQVEHWKGNKAYLSTINSVTLPL